MTTPVRLRFGIKTAQQHTSYEEMLRIWREADALPIFEHAWLFDHFQPIVADRTGPCLEGWTLLAALAAQTQRLRVGVMVTGVTYRHPAVLANMAATVDVIIHGRLEFGIGAAWNEREHASYGIPFCPDAERIRRLGEACEVIRRLWTQSVADFDGQYYQLKQARCPRVAQRVAPFYELAEDHAQWGHPIGGKRARCPLPVRVACREHGCCDRYKENHCALRRRRHA